MSEFAITISCLLNDTDTDTDLTTFVLDTVNDNTIDLSSQMSVHPMVNGDQVADHIINEPSSMTISGVFSKNGSKSTVVDKNGSHLENVQEMFEKIKRQGIPCDIVKIQTIKNETGEKRQPVFKKRSNMILTRISWTERINSLGFSFTFNEAILADVITLNADTDDAFLPNIEFPSTMSFTNELIPWDYIDKVLYDSLDAAGLIGKEFKEYVRGMSNATVLGIVGAVGGAVLGASIAKLIGLGAAAGGPWGALAGAAVGVVIGIVNWIDGIIQRNKYRIDPFNNGTDEEVKRYAELIVATHQLFEPLNEQIKVYKITELVDQECILTIDNNYYIFTLVKNNTTNDFDLKIKDINDVVVGQKNNLKRTALDNIMNCKLNNSIFETSLKGPWVYSIKSENEYFFMVSSINMETFEKIVEDIIVKSLGY